MRLIRVSTSPTVALLDAALDHARIDEYAPGQDTINDLLAAAVEFIEGETRQTLFTTRYKLHLDGFPADAEVTLPRPPFQGIEAITYVVGGTAQSLPESAFTPDPSGSMPGRVKFHAIPQPDDKPNSVVIDFTAGYGDAADQLPFLLRQAVLLVFAYWFNHREAAHDRRIDALPLALQSIIAQQAFPEVL